MAIYKLDALDGKLSITEIENIEPSLYGYSYGLPNGDLLYLTGDFVKHQFNNFFLSEFRERQIITKLDADKNYN